MAAPLVSTRTVSPSLPVATRRTKGTAAPERSPAGESLADGGGLRGWWLPGLVVGLVCAVATAGVATWEAWPQRLAVGGVAWWAAVAVTHLPLVVIGAFLVGGFVEHVGYFWRGRVPRRPGRLPEDLPKVCVQLPMFNEHAVARRLIEAACALRWPVDRLTVQVLDDSTAADTRELVDGVCRRMRAERGVDCVVLHRSDRRGYKAGALEAGRRRTDAELLAIFDADFVPPVDFLVRAVAHFYDEHGVVDEALALVQAQWGHLNHDESPLTRAQSLWVDDHHTVQMSWRSAQWRFVNFTGTAGIWRARAVEAAGGWRAASLVEDCELSFRHLFAGYRTTFVKDIVVPAELPGTFTAYKAQQKRWTQGWVQLQRLHLGTLLTRYPTGLLRRLHLAYHMCIAWQWPAWALWAMAFPLAIATGIWLGALDASLAAIVYVLPALAWLVLSTVVASLETRHTYHDDGAPGTLRRRLGRIAPYVVVNTGMLPHQCSAFAEGLFGPMHSEFERTPKTGATVAASGNGHAASATPVHRRAPAPKRRPYQLTEAFYVVYQFTWAGLFACQGLVVCAIAAAYMAGCVVYVATRHGQHRASQGRHVARPPSTRTRATLIGGEWSGEGGDDDAAGASRRATRHAGCDVPGDSGSALDGPG
jgi:cellulose synthase/poly-beta-1,6-N-acetylglucosamine synthase-like glycosyltransferase